MKSNQIWNRLFALILVVCLLLTGCSGFSPQDNKVQTGSGVSASLEQIPAYSGNAFVVLEGNQPDFDTEKISAESFETYGELDSLGRCTEASACIGQELMPTEERGQISPVRPSGWQTARYDCVEGKYLYNRCHLIGFQLTGENANKKNLITGTRYLNVEGMLPFENQVAEYIKSTGNHVYYRVTPVFEGTNLVAGGVRMEAWSVEDQGKGVCFHVYAYNVQPGVVIDYATGDSRLAGEEETEHKEKNAGEVQEYVLNTNTHKFHRPTCSGAADTKEENKMNYTGTKAELESQGYEPCGRCKP